MYVCCLICIYLFVYTFYGFGLSSYRGAPNLVVCRFDCVMPGRYCVSVTGVNNRYPEDWCALLVVGCAIGLMGHWVWGPVIWWCKQTVIVFACMLCMKLDMMLYLYFNVVSSYFVLFSIFSGVHLYILQYVLVKSLIMLCSI